MRGEKGRREERRKEAAGATADPNLHCRGRYPIRMHCLLIYTTLIRPSLASHCGIYRAPKGSLLAHLHHARAPRLTSHSSHLYALSPERTLSIVSVFTFDHVPLRPSAVYVHSFLSPTLLVQRRPAFGSLSASLELHNAYRILFKESEFT